MAAQNKAFGDITQQASNRGMLFSGFTPEMQARYNADKTLPALANLRAANQGTIDKLNQAILGLDSDQRKQAMSMQEQDLSRLYDYQKTQEQRQWEAQQAQVAYEREMAKLRATQSFQASQNNQTSNPATELINLFKNNWANSKGTASRNTQDNWVREWMMNNGVVDPTAQQQVWNLVNQQFNRTNNPWEDRMWNGGK